MILQNIRSGDAAMVVHCGWDRTLDIYKIEWPCCLIALLAISYLDVTRANVRESADTIRSWKVDDSKQLR